MSRKSTKIDDTVSGSFRKSMAGHYASQPKLDLLSSPGSDSKSALGKDMASGEGDVT